MKGWTRIRGNVTKCLTNLGSDPRLVRMKWIPRDIEKTLKSKGHASDQPIKILKGPRQVGKTTLLLKQKRYEMVSFDDHATRNLARENPSFFLDQVADAVLLDEATYAPEIFPELKLRADKYKWNKLEGNKKQKLDIWVTGSNQFLLRRSVQESLAGRARYYDLNTLSMHELKNISTLEEILLRGGWPELHSEKNIDPISHINDLISTFIEKDIVQASGIERKDSFSRLLPLLAGRVGQLNNASDLAKNIGVDTTTVQSWIRLLEDNGILITVQPYFNNLSQRWIKTPKTYFLDTGLAVRLQGWTQFQPLLTGPMMGSLYENLILTEIHRFLINTLTPGKVYFLRNKEKVEVDFLVSLPNQKWIAIEVKSKPEEWTSQQLDLLEKTGLPIQERWIVTEGSRLRKNQTAKILSGFELFDALGSI